MGVLWETFFTSLGPVFSSLLTGQDRDCFCLTFVFVRIFFITVWIHRATTLNPVIPHRLQKEDIIFRRRRNHQGPVLCSNFVRSCSDHLWSIHSLSPFLNFSYMIQQNQNHHLRICVLTWLRQVTFGISCSLSIEISQVTPINFLEDGLSCTPNITAVARSCRFALYNICRIRFFRVSRTQRRRKESTALFYISRPAGIAIAESVTKTNLSQKAFMKFGSII